MAQFESEMQKDRGVAQLVARYVRDVEVGCSSHLTPTKKDETNVSSFFVSLLSADATWKLIYTRSALNVSTFRAPHLSFTFNILILIY